MLHLLPALVCAIAVENPQPWWHAGGGEATTALRERVIGAVDRASLRAMHESLTWDCHIAGTEGDDIVITKLRKHFSQAGLEVDVHDIWPLLAHPVSAKVEVVVTSEEGATTIELPLRERALAEDRHSGSPELAIGFNAYSASGSAQGEVVYANYGTREDFASLTERGIDCAGKIVVARYGRNFRGYKALYAEQAGAAGLLIFTDPKDSGTGRGEPYPEGGWANETSIQRGSILTLDYPGDPLTPFIEATEHAQRAKESDVALPKIPVQPIGWEAAREILSRMGGAEVPEEWRGGLDVTYRFTGGTELNVRMQVEQHREVMRTANVIATLTGTNEPDQYIVVGCHHDAWCHGASDPLAGLIVVTELARAFGEAAKNGVRPARSIIFAAWGAEEYGIIGSTEWCEANRDKLLRGGIAYINLDMAAMGLNFGASASPSLRGVVAHAAGLVSHPSNAQQTVLASWLAPGGEAAESGSMPAFGTLGGGSDHVGFYCHLGIPSCALGGGGSEGTAYHSNYDTITWYKKVVGEDYKSADMITQVCAAMICELANAPLLPLDPRGYADDGLTQLTAIEERAAALDVALDLAPLKRAMTEYRETANAFVARVSAANTESDRDAINKTLQALEQAWLAPDGLPGRPWFRSLYGASDPYSGYAAWVFPALRLAIEEKDAMGAAVAAADIMQVYAAMTERLKS